MEILKIFLTESSTLRVYMHEYTPNTGLINRYDDLLLLLYRTRSMGLHSIDMKVIDE